MVRKKRARIDSSSDWQGWCGVLARSRPPASEDTIGFQSFGGGKAFGPVAFAALTDEPGDLESGHFSQVPSGDIGQGNSVD